MRGLIDMEVALEFSAICMRRGDSSLEQNMKKNMKVGV